MIDNQIEYFTSIDYIITNEDGTRLLHSDYIDTWANTEAESVAAAIAGYEKAGHTADQLLSIKTVAYENWYCGS